MVVTPRVRKVDARVAVPLAAAAGIIALLVAGPLMRAAGPDRAGAAAVTPAPSADTPGPGAPAALAPFGPAEASLPQLPQLPQQTEQADQTGPGQTETDLSGTGQAQTDETRTDETRTDQARTGHTATGQTQPSQPADRSWSPRSAAGAGPAPNATPPGMTSLHRPAAPTTRHSRRHAANNEPARTASTPAITITAPKAGSTASTIVEGKATPAGGHQVWLFSRAASGAPYRVESHCRGTRDFSCDVTRPAAGEDKFRLAVVIVDPTTAESLRPGDNWETLPRHAARDEVVVRH